MRKSTLTVSVDGGGSVLLIAATPASFCYVGSNGNAGYYTAGISIGVSFGFCV